MPTVFIWNPENWTSVFTVYGPWGRPDMAPMIFADAILSNKTIDVFNNGEMLRDFTYIEDVVKLYFYLQKTFNS